MELGIAQLSGSVGLLGDALHNLSEVSTSLAVFLGFGSEMLGFGVTADLSRHRSGPHLSRRDEKPVDVGLGISTTRGAEWHLLSTFATVASGGPSAVSCATAQAWWVGGGQASGGEVQVSPVQSPNDVPVIFAATDGGATWIRTIVAKPTNVVPPRAAPDSLLSIG